MTLTVRPYTPDDLAGVHAEYSRLVVGRVPHNWPVSLEEFGAMVDAPDLEREGARLTEQSVKIVGDDDGPAGFIHLGLQAPRDGVGPPVGVIRFLAYRRGERPVGNALLQAGESWLRERGASRSVTIPQPWRYPFYGFAHAFLSDHLDHVQALLRFRGYRKVGGEVFLDWPDMAPVMPEPLPDLPCEVTVKEVAGAGRLPGVQLDTVRNDDGVGQCVLVSGGEFSRGDEAQAFAFCDWLGVQDEWQGRGLGRYLLLRALWEARERGYRHGAISTAFDNDRAFLFYTNHGFRVVDWTYEFERELS